MRRTFLLFLFFVLIFTACGPQLSHGRIVFEQAVLKVEIADTPEARNHGLMFRKKLSKDKGMLFDFKEPAIYHFWMKNTEIPLSIAFLSRSGEVLKVENMVPKDSKTIHTSPNGTRFAIEANEGWFAANGISVGSVAQIEGVTA